MLAALAVVALSRQLDEQRPQLPPPFELGLAMSAEQHDRGILQRASQAAHHLKCRPISVVQFVDQNEQKLFPGDSFKHGRDRIEEPKARLPWINPSGIARSQWAEAVRIISLMVIVRSPIGSLDHARSRGPASRAKEDIV